MLCYATTRHAMRSHCVPCHAMPCYAMLCHAAPCCAMLRCSVLRYPTPRATLCHALPYATRYPTPRATLRHARYATLRHATPRHATLCSMPCHAVCCAVLYHAAPCCFSRMRPITILRMQECQVHQGDQTNSRWLPCKDGPVHSYVMLSLQVIHYALISDLTQGRTVSNLALASCPEGLLKTDVQPSATRLPTLQHHMCLTPSHGLPPHPHLSMLSTATHPQ